jgi:NAD(P)-dependent dehydrogenase (short-subunit alcohol dehydrogenase family)
MTTPIASSQLARLHERYPLKRAAITGSGSGVGEALALTLAGLGWTLFLNDVEQGRLAAVSAAATALGGRVFEACFNVADLAAFDSPVTQFLDQHGGIDLVFACAGIGVGGSFLNTLPEHFSEVINVNLLGTIWTGKAFIPSMVQARHGHFVTIASAAAFHGLPHLSGYAATKAGVVQLSETLRSELAPHGVDVTVKMTTFYTSNIADYTRGAPEEVEKARSLVQMAPWNSAEVARALLFAVQARQFYMVAPGQAKFLWRFKRLLPELYLKLMPRLFPKLEAKLLAKARERENAAKLL